MVCQNQLSYWLYTFFLAAFNTANNYEAVLLDSEMWPDRVREQREHPSAVVKKRWSSVTFILRADKLTGSA